MRKKVIAGVAALCMIGAGAFGTAYADADLADAVAGGGYIESESDQNVPKSAAKTSEKDAFHKGGYPAVYPSGGIDDIRRMYPPTRSQSPYGTCWAHAVAACADFDMVKNHGQSAYTFNVSELQLAYYTSHTAIDRLGYLDGDVNKVASGAKDNFLNIGGNSGRAMRTLAQWKGFTYELNVPYSSAQNALTYGLAASNAYRNDAAKLEKAYTVDIKTNPNAVKQAIMQYGAVAVSYEYDLNYYNRNANSYRNPYDHGTDHASAIVGWDDNFAASNFSYPASRNGAWLIRNSGTTDNVASNAGYFWMSYEDASLSEAAYVMDFMPTDRYDHNYQHDGTVFTGGIKVEAAANVFTTRNINGAASETLDAVMLSFDGEAGVQYQIDIYSSLTDRGNPESGYHHSYATTTGTLSYAGIYTIPLNQKVYLAPGETFSVVVKSLDGRRYFDSECSKIHKYEDGTPRVETVAHADPGESFYKGRISDQNWIDCTADKYDDYGNMCIKALTNDSTVTKYTITYNLNGGSNHESNPKGFYLSTQSGSVNLQNPVRNGYHFLGWYTDAGFTQKVTAVNYDVKANQTFYAKWCADSNPSNTTLLAQATADIDGSYQVSCSGCGRVTGTYPIYRLGAMWLDAAEIVYTGEDVSPCPVVYDAAGAELVNGVDYTYTYDQAARKNAGHYSVTVTFMNKYSGSAKLEYDVVLRAPATASAKLTGYNDIKVSWSKSTGVDGYYVYYKKASAQKYSKVKRTTKRYVKFNNLSGNVKYNFKIVPYYKIGDTRYKSAKSKVVSARTLKKLAQPKMKKVSGNRVSLTWQSIKGAGGYQVYWATSKNGKYKKLCDYGKQYTGVTFTVGKGETYWYKTRAYKKVGKNKIYAPWSAPKKFIR